MGCHIIAFGRLADGYVAKPFRSGADKNDRTTGQRRPREPIEKLIEWTTADDDGQTNEIILRNSYTLQRTYM